VNSRSISAFRVRSTLKKVGTLNSSAKIHILARQKGFFSSFFLVDESWEDELEAFKSVRVLAEINCSKDTGNVQLAFVDPSLKFSPLDIQGLSSIQKSVQSMSI
jgi:hypothetical protein